jgi:hypothetical protein
MIEPVLTDSDILIEVFRGRSAEILRRWEELAESGSMVAYSPVSSAELWHGARSADAAALAALFSSLTCVPIDATIGKRAGEYLSRYYASHGMGIGDALIAATASVHGLRLWTRNRKHYPMRDLQHF